MSLEEDKNKKILIIILVIAVIILGIYKLFFENKSKHNEAIDTKTISIVKNQNDFYLVSSCVSRYLNYLSADDKEKLLMLLSDNYKNENSVTSENIYNFISRLDGLYSFNPRKMYVQRMSENVYKFYVYGLIEKDTIDLDYAGSDYYVIVILDKANTTFAIEPYDGGMF